MRDATPRAMVQTDAVRLSDLYLQFFSSFHILIIIV